MKISPPPQSTPLEGTIDNMFGGKLKNYVQCVNVDYGSSWLEPFYGLLSTISLPSTVCVRRFDDSPCCAIHTSYHSVRRFSLSGLFIFCLPTPCSLSLSLGFEALVCVSVLSPLSLVF